MIIHIQSQELEQEFINPVRNGFVSHPAIDYQTNAIHAQYEGRDVILFKFVKYGWLSDNRFNTYNLSLGPAGITIEILL
jgi:hypothetical protein